MIRFTDNTLREGDGNFGLIKEIMEREGPSSWMLRTTATVIIGIESEYILHLWSDGRVVIMGTNRPISLDLPDDDIRHLSEWCKNSGWRRLEVYRSMIEDPTGFNFWMRMFIAGLIYNDEIDARESQEMERMEDAHKREQTQEEEEQWL